MTASALRQQYSSAIFDNQLLLEYAKCSPEAAEFCDYEDHLSEGILVWVELR
jgi:hypothetical protein